MIPVQAPAEFMALLGLSTVIPVGLAMPAVAVMTLWKSTVLTNIRAGMPAVIAPLTGPLNVSSTTPVVPLVPLRPRCVSITTAMVSVSAARPVMLKTHF